jgi:hypothetical protein
MPLFDTWAQYMSDLLRTEGRITGGLVRHSGIIGNAREALVQQVLLRFLPTVYEIGTGQVVDSSGNMSRQMDIVVARRDMPSLRLTNGAKLYIIECVLCVIQVKSVLNSDSLESALESVASVADLDPNVVAGQMDAVAASKGLERTSNGEWAHSNPLETARFFLSTRPAGYIFGYTGLKAGAHPVVSETMARWINGRRRCAMMHLPAVVAGEGVFAWRNTGITELRCQCILLLSDPKRRGRILRLRIALPRMMRDLAPGFSNGVQPIAPLRRPPSPR